jgi:hypothetical protein
MEPTVVARRNIPGAMRRVGELRVSVPERGDFFGGFLMKKMAIDPIKAEYFYADESEKTKLNWFCYEYAFVLYNNIRKGATLKKYRKKHTQDKIVDFCVYFSKIMKKSIYEKLGGLVEYTTIYEEYVEDYYPLNTRRENSVLLGAAVKAWDELLSNCVVCPNRCISEMNEKCMLFDRLDEDEFLM